MQLESKVSSKGPCLKGLVLSAVLLGGSGTFKRWPLVHKSLGNP